ERAEERLAGDDVDVDARLMVVPVLVLERALRALVLRHVVLERRQLRLELAVARLLVVHRVPSFRRLGGGGGRGVLSPELLPARIAAAAASVRLVPERILLVIALVVLFGRPELAGADDLGDDRLVEALRILDLLLRRLGQPLLVRVGSEDGRAVLRTVI